MQVRAAPRPVLVLLEGNNDLEFFSLRLSRRVLLPAGPKFPTWRRGTPKAGSCLCPPAAGTGETGGATFQGLGCREFHLLDRETGAETVRRRQAVRLVNDRPDCRGFLTSKRAWKTTCMPKRFRRPAGARSRSPTTPASALSWRATGMN